MFSTGVIIERERESYKFLRVQKKSTKHQENDPRSKDVPNKR